MTTAPGHGETFPVLFSSDEWAGNGSPVKSIPWAAIAKHEPRALANHGRQSLKRLAERGGLSVTEILAVMEDRPWTGTDADIAKGRDLVRALNASPTEPAQATGRGEGGPMERLDMLMFNCWRAISELQSKPMDVMTREMVTALEAQWREVDALVKAGRIAASGGGEGAAVVEECIRFSKNEHGEVVPNARVRREIYETVIDEKRPALSQPTKEGEGAEVDQLGVVAKAIAAVDGYPASWSSRHYIKLATAAIAALSRGKGGGK